MREEAGYHVPKGEAGTQRAENIERQEAAEQNTRARAHQDFAQSTILDTQAFPGRPAQELEVPCQSSQQPGRQVKKSFSDRFGVAAIATVLLVGAASLFKIDRNGKLVPKKESVLQSIGNLDLSSEELRGGDEGIPEASVSVSPIDAETVSQRIETYIEQATEKEALGDYNAAVSFYDQAIELRADWAFYRSRAGLLLKAERYAEALDGFSHCIDTLEYSYGRLDRSAELHEGRGDAYLGMEKYPDAVLEYEFAMGFAGGSPDIRTYYDEKITNATSRMIKTLGKEGNVLARYNALRKLEEEFIRPPTSQEWEEKANQLSSQFRYREAIDALSNAIEASSSSTEKSMYEIRRRVLELLTSPVNKN